MRRSSTRVLAVAAIAGLIALAAPAVRAQLDQADRLDIPARPLPRPEDGAAAGSSERLTDAARALAELGYPEVPYVAWAMVESSRRDADPELAESAVESAPESPAVWFAAARAWRSPKLLAGGLAALPRSFPALLWAWVAAGALLGASLIVASLLVFVLAALRGSGLAGHALAHGMRVSVPVAWPGILLGAILLAPLAAIGVGPVALLALAGAAGALYLRPAEAAAVGIGLAVTGLVLGPGVDFWTRPAVELDQQGVLASAWRVERGHALPGDPALLERALERRPADPLARLALATARIRAGDPAAGRALLAGAGTDGRGAVDAAVQNLRGALELAAGEVGSAVEYFEKARAERETAAVLFNLSQAYGRALRLAEQASTYTTARALDAEIVAFRREDADRNLHHFLMPVRVPAALYLQRALEPSPRAVRLARALRARLLGRALPDPAWMALPLLGLICVGLRRSTLTRCSRCERMLCAHCAPENLGHTTCVRCVRLFEGRENVDARVRREQLELDRLRQRSLRRRMAAAVFVVPGVSALREGRTAAGTLRLVLCAFAGAVLALPRWLATPWEVGLLASWTAWGGGALLAALYLRSLAEALRLMRAPRGRA